MYYLVGVLLLLFLFFFSYIVQYNIMHCIECRTIEWTLLLVEIERINFIRNLLSHRQKKITERITKKKNIKWNFKIEFFFLFFLFIDSFELKFVWEFLVLMLLCYNNELNFYLISLRYYCFLFPSFIWCGESSMNCSLCCCNDT